jgi:hypothetical protein
MSVSSEVLTTLLDRMLALEMCKPITLWLMVVDGRVMGKLCQVRSI